MKNWLYLPLLLTWPVTAAAASPEYLRDIKPLLAVKCSSCHGALQQQSGLRLDAGALIQRGGDSGPVVEPGNAGASELIARISTDDLDVRMPPEGEGEPLTVEQVELIAGWINSGAQVPEDEEIPRLPEEHWAYQVPIRPTVPEVVDSRWTHPIDAFLAEQHERVGLQPVDLADSSTLLRRAYFDLVGLPPTRQQQETFLPSDCDQAWSNLVDQLLDSPHYGERWGRHWMDVWRYSDWDGYKQELRGSQRHIWRWRDWIVESLNDDKGYDQMIMEMLAGDEIAPDDPSVLRATGFLARNYHKSNRNIWLDATVEHTAKAFLGLTINCARCHDHKYDPLPQLAYYQLRAVFEPHNVRTDRIPGQLDVAADGIPRAFDADLAAETFLYLRGNDKLPDKENPVEPAVPGILGGEFHVEPVELPPTAFFPALQEFVARDQIAAAREELAKAQLALANRSVVEDSAPNSSDIALLERRRAVAQLRVYSIKARREADQARLTKTDTELAKQRAAKAGLVETQLHREEVELEILERQEELREAESLDDESEKRAAVAKARKAIAAAKEKRRQTQEAASKKEDSKREYTPLGKEYPRTSTGRRLALAKWITRRTNPLTARVAVNHVWMRHFGTPLVDNVFDFGLRSPKPRHAELLDWLAAELMDNDWSIKHLHRLILTSRSWRLRSSASPDLDARNQLVDRDNHYFWRANVRRLDAEIVRDNLLAVTDGLDPRLGGSDIDFREGEESKRRSIYLRHAYEKQMTMLVLFDAASPNECYRRSESIVPQQALALSNSSLSLGRSRLLTRQLWQETRGHGQPQVQFVIQAFRQILARRPLDEELDACKSFLVDQAKTLSDQGTLTTFVGGNKPTIEPATDPAARARENLVHVLLNHNDFVTVR